MGGLPRILLTTTLCCPPHRLFHRSSSQYSHHVPQPCPPTCRNLVHPRATALSTHVPQPCTPLNSCKIQPHLTYFVPQGHEASLRTINACVSASTRGTTSTDTLVKDLLLRQRSCNFMVTCVMCSFSALLLWIRIHHMKQSSHNDQVTGGV